MINNKDINLSKINSYIMERFVNSDSFDLWLVQHDYLKYLELVCKIEKKKFPNSNVLANDPDLFRYLEEQYRLGNLTPTLDCYPTSYIKPSAEPSYIVNGSEYVRSEDDLRIFWDKVEEVNMIEVYDEIKELINSINEHLPKSFKSTTELPLNTHDTANIFLAILKEEFEKILFLLEADYPSLVDKSSSQFEAKK